MGGGGGGGGSQPDPAAAERRRKAEEEAKRRKEERFLSLLERGTGRLGAQEGAIKKNTIRRAQGNGPQLSKISGAVEDFLGSGYGKSLLGR